jgi:hypothetical protein
MHPRQLKWCSGGTSSGIVRVASGCSLRHARSSSVLFQRVSNAHLGGRQHALEVWAAPFRVCQDHYDVSQGSESGLAFGDGGKGVQQVAGGSRQPVEPCRHPQVAGGAGRSFVEAAPVGFCSAHMHVAEYLLASGLGQLPGLGVSALALATRRHPCVAVFHAPNYGGDLCRGETLCFQCVASIAWILTSETARSSIKCER